MWFTRAALLVPAAILLGSCTGGGGSATHLYIQTNGSGSCIESIVVIDLAAAGARVSRSRDDHPECRIGGLLESSGCNARFLESNDRDELRIVVDDCDVPASATLASCTFFLGSAADLTPFVTSSHCACTSESCFETPGVCVDEDDRPGACEHCTNQVDDDDNGFTDCADANCASAPVCRAVTTTSTSTSTSDSFVSSTPTTDPPTTTIPVKATCLVTFRLEDDIALGSLQWDTPSADSNGSFETRSIGMEDCTILVDDVLSAFHLNAGVLRSGVISLEGFQGPTNLVRCAYEVYAGGLPQPADFEPIVTEASDTSLSPIQPLPEVAVSQVDCQTAAVSAALRIP